MKQHGKVIAEREGRGWLVLMPDSTVQYAATKAAVLALVKALGVGVTVLEWRL